MHVEVEQRFLLVPLLLVLLANPDHLSQHPDVEAVALGFGKDFPLGLVELLDLLVDVLNALDDRPQLVAWNVGRSAHGLLLVNTTGENSSIRANASRLAGKRGKQAVNMGQVGAKPITPVFRLVGHAPRRRRPLVQGDIKSLDLYKPGPILRVGKDKEGRGWRSMSPGRWDLSGARCAILRRMGNQRAR